MIRGSFKHNFNPVTTIREPLHETPAFQYIKLLLIIATLVVSILILVEIKQATGANVAQTISTDVFLAKLTSHDEARAFVGVAPLNIVQINNENIANLQTQISGLDTSFMGDYIVQYTDAIIIFDYDNDAIKGVVSLQQPQQSQLPEDFTPRLNAHPELSGLEDEQPIGGQLDQASLDTLKQQFPQVYANAKVGDFLLRYTTILIIYDYNADLIVNAVNLA